MKRLHVIGISVSLIGAAAVFWAVDAAKRPRPVLSEPPLMAVEGSITNLQMDFPRPEMLVTDKNKNVSKFLLDKNATLDPNATLVSQKGHVVTMGQLEKGQKVKVKYSQEADGNVARYVEILTPVAAPIGDNAPAVQEPDKATPATK